VPMMTRGSSETRSYPSRVSAPHPRRAPMRHRFGAPRGLRARLPRDLFAQRLGAEGTSNGGSGPETGNSGSPKTPLAIVKTPPRPVHRGRTRSDVRDNRADTAADPHRCDGLRCGAPGVTSTLGPVRSRPARGRHTEIGHLRQWGRGPMAPAPLLTLDRAPAGPARDFRPYLRETRSANLAVSWTGTQTPASTSRPPVGPVRTASCPQAECVAAASATSEAPPRPKVPLDDPPPALGT